LNSLWFGSLSRNGQGAGIWKNIQLFANNQKIFVNDLRFELNFPVKQR